MVQNRPRLCSFRIRDQDLYRENQNERADDAAFTSRYTYILIVFAIVLEEFASSHCMK